MEAVIKLLHDRMGLVLGIALLIVFIIILCVSGSIRAQLKHFLLILVAIAVLSTGYYLVTGRSATEIPHLVSTYFNTPQAPETMSHKYYQDPERGEENMGED